MNAFDQYGHGPGPSPFNGPTGPHNITPPPGRPIPPPPLPNPRLSHHPSMSSHPPFPSPSHIPRPPAPGGGRNTGMIVAVIAVVVLVLGALGAGGWHLFQQRAVDETAQQSTVSTTVRSPSAQASSASTTTPRAAPPVVSIPPGARTCPAEFGPTGEYVSSAAGTTITSCPFAEAVRVAYAGAGQAGAARTVTATSSVTGRSYPMSCTPVGGLVTCTGGDNAVVYVY